MSSPAAPVPSDTGLIVLLLTQLCIMPEVILGHMLACYWQSYALTALKMAPSLVSTIWILSNLVRAVAFLVIGQRVTLHPVTSPAKMAVYSLLSCSCFFLLCLCDPMALLQMLPEWLWQPFLEASLLTPSSSLLLGLDVAEAVRLCFFFVMLSLFGASYIVLALSRPLLTQHYLPVETRQRAMSLMQPLVITSLILCSSLVPLFAGHDLSTILPTSSLIVLAIILIQVIALFSFQSIKRSSQQSQQQSQQSQSESPQTNSNLPAQQNSSSNSSSSSSRTVSNDDASLWRSIANTFAESPSFCSLFAAWSLITLAFGIFSNATLMANPLFYPGMQQPLSLPGLPELSYAQQVAACSVMGQLSSSLWSPLWMSLRRRYGMRRMWMSACVCFCSCLLWPALPLNQGGPLSLCLVSLLSGFSLSPFFLYPVISLMEIDEHSLTRSGVSRMALFMSIVGCTNTLCSMLQGFFSGLVLSAVHFQPSAITESSAQGIAFLFSYIPATLVFISIWCIFGYSVPPLNN